MAKGISTFYGQQYLEPEAPNIIINSDLYRWERGISVAATNNYTADRFMCGAYNQVELITIKTIISNAELMCQVIRVGRASFIANLKMLPHCSPCLW